MGNEHVRKKRYVFQVIREEIVRTEIIKASDQQEAENMLAASDPSCTFKFLWIQTRSKIEKPPSYTWLRIFLIFAAIFFVTGLLLFLFNQSNYFYLFLATLASLLMAAFYAWRHDM